MNGAQFQAWREAAKITQTQAGGMVGGYSRKTVMRWEAEPSKAIPAKAAAYIDRDGGAPDPAPVPAATIPAAKAKAKAGKAGDCPAGCDPLIHEALKRAPLYSLTSAEGKAMRQELSRRGLDAPTIPLEPKWQDVRDPRGCVVRKVNAAIPDPISAPAPSGWGFVMTKSGAMYDYRTAHRVTQLQG